jgi:putative membrane protein
LNRPLHAATWCLFIATLYLILAGGIHDLHLGFTLPDLGNVGFTLVFVLFALLHCTAVEGAVPTARFFAISSVISYLMEEIGVRTGLIFGAYHYSDHLGAKLGHVPIIIPLAWFMMIYPSRAVARALIPTLDARSLRGLTALASLAALVMTGWDVVMDPPMAAAGNWIWENGGAYFGVPRHNYAGWLLTTFLVYWIVGWLAVATPTPQLAGEPRKTQLFASLPVIVYAFFALRYVEASRLPALQLIALFSMGVPAFIALLQLAVAPLGQPTLESEPAAKLSSPKTA